MDSRQATTGVGIGELFRDANLVPTGSGANSKAFL